ncbi:hypothetical protein PENSTE_c005G01571 [Penicillium steckii]|uniref:glutathione transferase n=1 Tax=Penicillium steckii TaxID=303698 RepID=A0A1V6TL48_9EURO|nr:hypothetical protein PENSTE_c005G01571 [Penicillium steckii]
MSLTIHHLHLSQSDRILWLCEELSIPYTLKTYNRDKQTSLSPESYKELHPIGTAPIIQEGSITLGETNAIFEYILTKYGQGRLVLSPDHPNYADYVFWLHHVQGTLQPALNSTLTASEGDMMGQVMKARLNRSLDMMNSQLKTNEYIAGDEFTAADCMMMFPLTTFRLFVPFSLEEYPFIVEYLHRISEREGYRVAMEKADPGLARPITAVVNLNK